MLNAVLLDIPALPEAVLPALLATAAVISIFVARNIQIFKKSISGLREVLIVEASRGDTFFSRHRVVKNTVYKLKKLDAPFSYTAFLTFNTIISSLLAALSLYVMLNPALAVILAIGWLLFSHQLVDRLYRIKVKNVIERQAQLMLQLLAELYEVSENLKQAIERVIDSTPQPLRRELENLIASVNTNKDMDHCLVEFAQNLDNRDINTFIYGIVLSRQFGSDTHEVIKMNAEVIRERMDLREELASEVRGKKAIIYIFMAALPAVFLWMYNSSADAQNIFTTTVKGQFLVSMLAVAEYLCWYFDNRKEVTEEL